MEYLVFTLNLEAHCAWKVLIILLAASILPGLLLLLNFSYEYGFSANFMISSSIPWFVLFGRLRRLWKATLPVLHWKSEHVKDISFKRSWRDLVTQPNDEFCMMLLNALYLDQLGDSAALEALMKHETRDFDSGLSDSETTTLRDLVTVKQALQDPTHLHETKSYCGLCIVLQND